MFLWDSRDATEKNKNNGTVADKNQEAPCNGKMTSALGV